MYKYKKRNDKGNFVSIDRKETIKEVEELRDM